MSKDLVLRKSITIDTTAQKVWNALTDPDMIKQYLFGTSAVSDWQVGSPILFKGVWKGSEYTDKGIILKYDVAKTFEYSYYSSFSGLPDEPGNYSIISFQLSPEGKGSTLLSLTQRNFSSDKMYEDCDKNWAVVLKKMKGLLET